MNYINKDIKYNFIIKHIISASTDQVDPFGAISHQLLKGTRIFSNILFFTVIKITQVEGYTFKYYNREIKLK